MLAQVVFVKQCATDWLGIGIDGQRHERRARVLFQDDGIVRSRCLTWSPGERPVIRHQYRWRCRIVLVLEGAHDHVPRVFFIATGNSLSLKAGVTGTRPKK